MYRMAMATIRRPRAALLIAGVATLAACQDRDAAPADTPSAAAPAIAPTLPPVTAAPAAALPLAAFAGRDADGDGRVTRAENATAGQALFQMIDEDRNGTIDLAEVETARSAIGGTQDIAPPPVVAGADSDRDGRLTLSEWMAMGNARFDSMDGDADGTVARAEWETAARPQP